ncbi:MAG TPA: hypothetical protein VN893_16145 [Bryobacteraceae bacterium]|nr:hypothetical protein [Bryobacteraceae bacterium]
MSAQTLALCGPGGRFGSGVCALILLFGACACIRGAEPAPAAPGTTLADLVTALRAKAKALEGTAGMKTGFHSFTASSGLQCGAVRFSDYVIARLLFEAARDAGFWNLHWEITNQPPNSDRIWRQWKTVNVVSPAAPTAIAECDELSALYSFLALRSGIHGMGLFWPTFNHTVAVWVLSQPGGTVRVVVPTTQIFLDSDDYFGTKKFDPWRQKTIHEYTRRDVPDSFELPQPLFAFFLEQTDKYAGASDVTLQLIRYWRAAVFQGDWTPDFAAREALRALGGRGGIPAEDAAAFRNFALDMQVGGGRR